MQVYRIGGASLNQTPLDWEGNRERILKILAEARQQGVALLCLPELCISGYGCEDAFFNIDTVRAAERSLAEILPATEGLTVLLGLPHYHKGALYNCAVMVQDGSPLGLNAKRYLPRDGVHYEPRWFRPWPQGEVDETELCGRRIPMGDVRYRFGRVGVAVEICEEAWGAVPAAADHAEAVEVVLNPSASFFALGRHRVREQLVADSSRALHVNYVYTNLLGLEAGRIIYDGTILIARAGDIVARAPRFGLEDGYLLTRDLDLDLARLDKMKTLAARHDPRPVKGIEVIGRAFESPKERMPEPQPEPAPAVDKREEFLQAEMLALADYLRKSGAKGYAVSLSGGCDSTVTALLVAHMVAHGMATLGPERFLARVGRSDIKTKDPREAVSAMLLTAYQGTAQSGDETRNAARAVAGAIGASHHEIDVQAAVDFYVKTGAKAMGRELTWERDDLTLQNIQARARAPMIWLLANATGMVLLSTSNRSEAAVGYATMDGDTAGGLAPLAGIDKAFLREWLKWAEKDCKLGLGPVPAVAAVNAMQPTAELRPKEKQQRDEDDLMPYDLLDRIERLLIRDRMPPNDVVACLVAERPRESPETLAKSVQKFLDLWTRNQWKRERLAPSFHLDDESVDPKTWCRYPILSRAPRVE